MRRRAALAVFVSAMSLLGTAAQREVVGQDAKQPTVEVTGDVLYPGAYPLTAGLTALDLLTVAGGSPKDTVHSLIIRYKETREYEDVPFSPKSGCVPVTC